MTLYYIGTCSACRLTKHITAGNHRCFPCQAAYNAAKNPRHNAISKIAYRMTGGSRAFYAKDKPGRLALRALAAELYDAGCDYVTAVENLPRRPDGHVYVITNPAWPEHVKIGCALNPDSRLRNYQTGTPHRDYRLEHFEYFDDRVAAEKELIRRLGVSRAEGEWHRINPGAAIMSLRGLADEWRRTEAAA